MTCLSHTSAGDVIDRSPPDAGGRRAGGVSVLALLFLAIFSALGVSYTTFANGSLLQGKNHANRLTARLNGSTNLDGAGGGTIHGTLISYGNTEFKLTGNSNLTIDRSTYPGLPSGPDRLAEARARRGHIQGELT